MTYHRAEVKAPRVAGLALKAFVRTLESGVGSVLLDKLVHDSGISQWRDLSPGEAPPVQHPLPHPESPSDAESPTQVALRVTAAPSGAQETVARYRQAYASAADPVTVMRRIHEEIERLDGRDDRMGWFIARKPEEVLAAAEASAKRLRAGAPLSVLDGVPVAIKDEIDVAGFPTTLGTRFRKTPASQDSTVAARLKAAGAVILGKVNMHEIGINTTGVNPWHGAARNPWNRGHVTGGSSSASAAVVGGGVCPISVGADGGGSVRIPAALCGVVGLKPTWGRIPETGVPPLCWNVGHLGPIGATVDDVAALYSVLAGPDDHDVISKLQPRAHLADYENADLAGVRLGICWPWFEDASPDVVARCREAVTTLTKAGAKVVELAPPDLNAILWTHSVLILSEMSEAMRTQLRLDSSQFALDSRTNLAIGQHFRATDYVHALRHRHAMTRDWLEQLKTCDVVVTPTCASTAPTVPEATLPEGESNLPVVDALMRFVRVANITGFPAISVNAGFDTAGLPVGVQLMGRPYEEHLLLRLARVVERNTEARIPAVLARALR